MNRTQNAFSTIRTEGSLLPADFLQRLLTSKSDIEGLRSEDYHLVGRERIDDAASRSWLRLVGAWVAFRDQLQRLTVDDAATTITREKWLYVLFSELNYGRLEAAKGMVADGKSYPVSHLSGHVPLHLVGANIDLDKRTRGAVGAATMSPHGLVQELLNRSDDYLWGVVSNGRVLRVLRDNAAMTRQAFVEFDLEAMFEGQDYHDFVLLWMLLHESRFEATRPEECWLEKWVATSRAQGTRALDALRGGVEAAITALGTGLVSHRGNGDLKTALRDGDLDKHDFYRQVLRVVYRMIFLFTAEDRELVFSSGATPSARNRYLKYYSVSRLRLLADRRRGDSHSDLWQQLLLTFNLFATGEGEAALGVPFYGGLFRDTDPLIANSQVSNLHLLEAIRALAAVTDGRARRRVDYRNMGAEELGSVYESLLEQHPDINLPTGSFTLGTAAGSERRTTGSYYTPEALITVLLDSALTPVLAERIETARRNKQDIQEAILGIRICDPACGSGHFLIAAAHRIARELAIVRTGDEEPSPAAQRHALREVVSRCIYGVDINPMAVELAQVSLWLEAIEPGKPLTFLEHHIRCGNSLLGATAAQVESGIPDEAFRPVEGDDKAIASSLRTILRARREGQGSLLELNDAGAWVVSWEDVQGFESVPDSVAELEAMAEAYNDYLASSMAARKSGDAWVAAFLAPKTLENRHQLERVVMSFPDIDVADLVGLGAEDATPPIHWHVDFPAVFETGVGSDNGFDVVVGNPPYGSLMSKSERNLAGYLYPSAQAASNAAADFLEACLQLCRRSGRIGLVVPKSLTYSFAWRTVRERLVEQAELVVDCGKAWDDVLLEQVIIVYSPGRRAGRLRSATLGARGLVWSAGDLARTYADFGVFPTRLSEEEVAILDVLAEQGLGTLAGLLRTRRGSGLQKFVGLGGDVPVAGGKSVRAFGPIEPVGRLNSESVPPGKVTMVEPGTVLFQNIVAHITRPGEHLKTIGTIADGDYAVLDTVNIVECSQSQLSPEATCALLMSRFVRWILFAVVYNRAIRTMHFDNYFLEKIPAPDSEYSERLNAAAAIASNEWGAAARERFEAEVMRAYGIPEDLWPVIFEPFGED